MPTSGELQSTLLKALVPLVAIALAIGASVVQSRRRGAGSDWKAILAVTPPRPIDLSLWVAASIALMLVSNLAMNWRGPWNFEPWRQQSIVVSALRILGVSVLGPIAEELIFRGFLFTRLLGTRLGLGGTIVVTGVAWALLHAGYGTAVTMLFVVYGLLLGAARWKTASVLVPIAMHITWNLYAVW